MLYLSCIFPVPYFCVLSVFLTRCLFLMNSFVTVSKNKNKNAYREVILEKGMF